MRRSLTLVLCQALPRRIQECPYMFSRFFSSDTGDTYIDNSQKNKTGRTRNKPASAQHSSHYQFSKGRRVSFHRMLKGPRRYIALLDSHMRRNKLDAAVRTAHKALNSDIVISSERCERILMLLLENHRLYDAESLVRVDSFHVSVRSLLLIMNPLIVSGRAELVLKLFNKISRKHTFIFYPEFKRNFHRAMRRRLDSNTQLFPNEEMALQHFSDKLKKVKWEIRYRDNTSVDSGDKINGWETNECTPISVRVKKKRYLEKLAGSRYLDVNNYFVEDRTFPSAPDMKFRDLSSALEEQGGMPLLFNSAFWSSNGQAYERRNLNEMEELLRAKQEQLDKRDEGDGNLPPVIAISIGTPGNPNMASSIWKSNEDNFEDSDNEYYDDGTEEENFEDDGEQNELDDEWSINDESELMEFLSEIPLFSELNSARGNDKNGLVLGTYDLEDDIEEKAYMMLHPVFRTEGEGSSATRESASKAYAFKEMIHYYGGAVTRLPPGFKDLTTSIEEMEKEAGIFGTDKAFRFNEKWERYLKNLKDPAYTTIAEEDVSKLPHKAPITVDEITKTSASPSTQPSASFIQKSSSSPKITSTAVTTTLTANKGSTGTPSIPTFPSEHDSNNSDKDDVDE